MSNPIVVDTRINHPDWKRWHSDLEADIMAALNTAATFTKSGAIDLLLTSDDEIQTLNRDWRGKDKPTDVLSFPCEDEQGETGFLGDIVISFGVMSQDAEVSGKSISAHFMHLLVHGYLHLLGFDHIEDLDAKRMETLEIKILAELGHPDPYSSAYSKEG